MSSSGSERRLRKFKEEPLRPGLVTRRPKGTLLLIGGHEDKEGEKLILREVVRLAGSGRLVVATIASQEATESWETYEPLFRRLGAPHVYHLQIDARAEAESVQAMRILEDATAIFFTGGDQLRITSLIGDTPLYSRLLEIYVEGGLIAGTSAGASVMSNTMLVGGSAAHSPRVKDTAQLAPGLGFVTDLVVDQHFAERGRITRLLGIVALNPRIIGVGIDEDTAAEITSDHRLQVLGSGAVTVLDGRSVTYTNVTDEEPNRAMSIFGATIHTLSQGDTLDLRKRVPRQGSAAGVEERAAEETRRVSGGDD
jgi:cyanophycinase